MLAKAVFWNTLLFIRGIYSPYVFILLGSFKLDLKTKNYRWIKFNRITLYYVNFMSIKLLFLKNTSWISKNSMGKVKRQTSNWKNNEINTKDKSLLLTPYKDSLRSRKNKASWGGNFSTRKWPMSVNHQWSEKVVHNRQQGCCLNPVLGDK